MQVEFLTLFLGLAMGVYPVELAVNGPVAAVELLLDGAAAGRVEGPPWRGEIDLGTDLLPHELVARALDRNGNEVDRAQQWINLPRPAAEVKIVLEGAGSRPTAARVSWQSLTGAEPTSVELTLDGRPLTLGPGGRAALPDYAPSAAHVLSAELGFPAGVTSRQDVVFGGRYGGEVSADLTAVPVRTRRGRGGRTPRPGEVQGALLANGRALSVAAVERGPAEVWVVRDLGAAEALADLGRVRPRRSRPLDFTSGAGPDASLLEKDPLRYEMGLGKEDQVRFLWPVPRTFSSAGLPAELFDPSRPYTLQDGGLHWLLTRVVREEETPGRQRLADAVAVAGLRAMSGNRPRAVLLLLGGNPEDASRYTPETVRRYLASIRVPLYVWTVEKGAAKSPAAALTAWGEVEDASSLAKLRRAVARLRDGLASQQIVWVEGRHLPQSIALAPAAPLELP